MAGAPICAPQFGAGAIVVQTQTTDGVTLLAEINAAVRAEALASGGASHPAARGIVSALGATR